MKRPGGTLSGRTRKLKKKRKFTARDFVKEFSIGEKVVISPKPDYRGGMPHPRYRGRHGVVIGKRGKAYIVKVKDGGVEKTLIAYPLHLEKLKV